MLPLLDPDANERVYENFDRNAVIFLKSITKHYTRETAGEVLDKLTEVFGRDWKDRIIFGMVAGSSTWSMMRLRRDHVVVNAQKINAIKNVRAVTGMGLAESKQFVENSDFQIVEHRIETMRAGYDEDTWKRHVENTIRDLNTLGYKAELV